MSNPEITPISKNNADHYVWGGQCDGWHLLKNPELSVIQERMPPGAAEIGHLHHRAQQFFYVLAGEATMEVDGRSCVLKAEEGVWIPTGVAHKITNKSGEDVHFLVISQPPSHGDRESA
jgi:mannose-6-phosphate isomerase-like protein (cupin superfamily)